ncbi:MAG: cupin domain-containing protein [Prevotella sp.]|nr:cupin domain-containing protein [Prevotella sp.]
MKIDFTQAERCDLPKFKDGEGHFIMRHYTDSHVRIMHGTLEPGCSIGLHRHEGNAEVMYILSGIATYIWEGKEETVLPGQVHYCADGQCHTLMNKGTENLTFFAVVPNK